MKSAISEPPNPNPIRIAELVFWKIMMMIVAPSRPRPTVNMPATPPVRNATDSARLIDPSRAAAAVRTLPRTARLMPMKPVRPERNAPATNAPVRAEPDTPHDNASTLIGPTWCFTAVDVRNTTSGQRDQDDDDRLELPLQVRHRALLNRSRDLLHLRRALIRREHAAHEHEADEERKDRGQCRRDEDRPFTSIQCEGLVAALGGE